MSNKYYEAGQHRAERVQDLFAAVAPRYDLINDLQSFGLHRWWKRRVIRLADPQPGERALDLCCGTGDVAFALSRRGCDVIGLDFSEPMLAVARLRITQSAAPRFLQGDAQSLPFSDNSFDLVTVSYGLRNLSDWKKGLSEMVRVARPGGRLLVLDFGKPDNLAWRRLYFFYLKWFVPIFGKIFCGDSQTHAYIMESLNHYPAQHGVAAAMNEMGCSAVKIVNLLGGVMTINYGKK
ncbi:MAG TPA: bifunctional demethylmenaquinone methyltransferase/2-methoxy-6-polyprenyl-1,4-benzoquinol methylase UbiE [Candidatus Saccharimonadales bacterium]|nr:bifunctional demethylmenaquinone methyltransferase/2-methoxy-6-polyprenyl-1,4-benzoquinol methylase UbiE [Candidatus Saccharimonadales bacterium]